MWIACLGGPSSFLFNNSTQGEILIRFAHMAGASALVLLAACGGPSSADLEKYSEACADFYKERRGKFGDEVEMRKHWTKDDKVVIALKVERRGERGYSRSCGRGPSEARCGLPSVFERCALGEVPSQNQRGETIKKSCRAVAHGAGSHNALRGTTAFVDMKRGGSGEDGLHVPGSAKERSAPDSRGP